MHSSQWCLSLEVTAVGMGTLAMSLLCPGFSDLSLGKVAAGSMFLSAGSWQQGQSLPHFPPWALWVQGQGAKEAPGMLLSELLVPPWRRSEASCQDLPESRERFEHLGV